MPTNSLTGLTLQSAILAIARALIKREKELGDQLRPHDVMFLVQGAHDRYRLLRNNDIVGITTLTADVVNAMTFFRELRTPSLVASGYHRLKSEFAEGGSSFRDPLPDLRLEPLQVPELEEH